MSHERTLILYPVCQNLKYSHAVTAFTQYLVHNIEKERYVTCTSMVDAISEKLSSKGAKALADPEENWL